MSFTVVAIILLPYILHGDAATPLQISKNDKNTFEFNFVVDWKLTMASYDEATGFATLLKYDVEKARYLINKANSDSAEMSEEDSKEKQKSKPGGSEEAETGKYFNLTSTKLEIRSKSKSEESGADRAANSKSPEMAGNSKSKPKRHASKESEEKEDQCKTRYEKFLDKGNNSILDHVIFGDGTHRRIMTINGQLPAPTIVVPLGSELVVRVSNHLANEGLAIHFHGIDKKNQWFMDGTSRLQQCPIGTGSVFTYRFTADTPGTHFYHGHQGMERAEGLYGAVIVMPEDRSVLLNNGSKIIPDVEYAVVLFDWDLFSSTELWYHDQWETGRFILGNKKNGCLKHSHIADGSVIGGSYPLSAITINDKGWYDQEDIVHRPHKLDLETFQIEEGGKTYLFRVINAGQAHPLMISIEDHTLEVVATDGSPIRGVPTDYVILYPGERYDILLISQMKPARYFYYMIVETLDYESGEPAPFYALAKIQYGTAKPLLSHGHTPDLKQKRRCTNKMKCAVVNCPGPIFPPILNKGCINLDKLENADHHIQTNVLKQSYATSEGGFEEYFINMNYEEVTNGWRFRYPKGPPYLYHGQEHLVMESCTENNWKGLRNSWCTYTLNVTLGSVVQLTITNTFGHEGSNRKEGYHHPVHLHGSHFYVVKIGYGGYNETTGRLETANPDIACSDFHGDCVQPSWKNSSWLHGDVGGMNLKNPVFKDTVLVPLGGYVVLRFKAENPGWWAFHCHIMEHHMAGMAFAIRVGEHDQMPAPPSKFPTCGVF